MEETKQKKEMSVEELKKQLFEAKQTNAKLYQEAQKQISELQYQNAFAQQAFMMDIIKNAETFEKYEEKDLVKKAMNTIKEFWFVEKPEVDEEKQS